VEADAVRLNIVDSRACPVIESVALYLRPESAAPEEQN
jgi:hypothetical protein